MKKKLITVLKFSTFAILMGGNSQAAEIEFEFMNESEEDFRGCKYDSSKGHFVPVSALVSKNECQAFRTILIKNQGDATRCNPKTFGREAKNNAGGDLKYGTANKTSVGNDSMKGNWEYAAVILLGKDGNHCVEKINITDKVVCTREKNAEDNTSCKKVDG
tara:strand:+ start:127 stop:609 length:483 start_codon:yes stop_codon:yes gene_type:complete